MEDVTTFTLDFSKSTNDNSNYIVYAKVLEIISMNINDKSEELLEDMEFAKIMVSSIRFVQLVITLEEEFGFEFDDDMLIISQFPDVKSFANYIVNKIVTI